MPELPEVETIKNQLSPEIINNIIVKVSQSSYKLRGGHMPNLSILEQEKIIDISRRNKYLIFTTSNYYVLIHLGMTGQLLIEKKIPLKKHVHIQFFLENKILYYQDIRRFGKIEIYLRLDYKNFNEIPVLKKLGFEPLEDIFTLSSLQILIKNLKNKKIPAKKFIMEGRYICGIGNIYANEILFLSLINPFASISSINIEQQNLLFLNIKKVLQQAIDLGGSTISDFIHINGSSGNMQNFYHVYGKENKLCDVCFTIIQRVKQYERSTFYCPYCQK